MTDPQRSTTGEEVVTSDLCVVGAGPAGLTIAQQFDGTDVSVTLLDSGGEEVDRQVQRQSRGESDGYPIHLLHRSRQRAFGGTLRHPELADEGWASRPLDPIDFEARPGRPHSGWPFDREHLEPYYARAHETFGIGPYDYDPRSWSGGAADPLLPLEGSEIDSTVFRYGPVEFAEARRRLTASSTVRLLLRTRVVDLRVDPTGRRVDSVAAVRPDGSRLTVRARLVVLATGGIENARLLLSADGGRGLGNEHDLVGRFFSERLSAHAGHVVAERPDLLDTTTFYTQHRVRRSLVFGALRVNDKIQRDRELGNCAFFIVPRPASVTTGSVRALAALRKLATRRPLDEKTSAHLRSLVRGAGDLGDFFTSRLRSVPEVLTVRAQGEQAPNPESRVTLGTARDDLGMPVPRVSWRIQDSDRASIATSLRILGEVLHAGGHGRVVSVIDDPDTTALWEGNHHHMGTTRMHADARQGVVDARSRVHSLDNLYVAGSSVFPTYGASNPTLTILALALRLSEHVAEELAGH
ncbi:GMC family oxidoreductase [Actinomycetospora lutea]|uniref:GMC oxidoreductase n=1 Tax=Actinomycetospora lutea TaxID=663604 RepID=UPI0023657DA6|nr:GMC family oxidoreductase [Actinomycetospora lutea]MDD7942860.1 GMC family oxidoreductase [Actinomycetospora lutea]